jgi:hypothetical protein
LLPHKSSSTSVGVSAISQHVPFSIHPPAVQLGLDPGGSCVNSPLRQYTDTLNNLHVNYYERNLVSPCPAGYRGLQYPMGAFLSTTFIEDAQYLLGANSEYYNPISNFEENYDASALVLQGPTLMGVTGQNPASALSLDQSTDFTQVVVTNSPQPSGQNLLTCPHGCRGSFSRPGEYRRHMKKHRTHQHMCPQPGCGKTFYRMDKVRDHLRQLHKIPRV